MKLLFPFVLALTLSVLAKAQSKQEQLIQDLSAQKFDWLINENYDSLESLFHPKLRYIHSNGLIESKEEAIENLKTDKLVYLKVIVNESMVEQVGNTVVVVGKGQFSGVLNGTEFSVLLLYTEVYVYTNKWQLLSRHASRLP